MNARQADNKYGYDGMVNWFMATDTKKGLEVRKNENSYLRYSVCCAKFDANATIKIIYFVARDKIS